MKRERENDINEIDEEEENEIQSDEDVVENDDSDNVDEEMTDNHNEEETEDSKDKVVIDKKSYTQKLAQRFIHTMAQTFLQSYNQGRLSRDRLRNYYFEAIQQISHEQIKEILFKVQSWNTFFYLIKKSLEFKDDTATDEKTTKNKSEQQPQQKSKNQQPIVVKNINNILRLNCIGAKESIEEIIKENKNNSIDHLYEQIILNDYHTPISSQIFNHHFKSKDSSNTVDLITKLNNLTLTSKNINNLNYIANVSELLEKIDYKNLNLVEQTYEQLKKYINISILPNISKNEDKQNESKFVLLATELLKLSLVLCNSNPKRSYQIDYTTISLMLGKVKFLGKVATMLTSFDFTVAPFFVNQKDGIISKFIIKFMEHSELTPPTSALSYLKSKILFEKAIQLFTITKDSMLLKLKIASASLLPPQSLIQYIIKHKDLLFTTNNQPSNNDIIKALRSSKLDTILKIQEQMNNEDKDVEENNEDNQEDDQELDITINKSGNRNESEEQSNQLDDEIEEDQKPTSESSKLLESLLDGLSDDDDEDSEDEE